MHIYYIYILGREPSCHWGENDPSIGTVDFFKFDIGVCCKLLIVIDEYKEKCSR